VALFAIGDLHLSFSSNKPMDIFGENWLDYEKKIEDNWRAVVKEDDIVLIPGDISWATKLPDAIMDLEWIDKLPGKKILLRGNHDYWWASLSKMNNLYDKLNFLQNDSYSYKQYAICGSRGWNCPSEYGFTSDDEKIYKRELLRLRLSLDDAKKKGFKKFIVMMHYPPTNDKLDSSGFTEIFEEYKVEKVIYGHLHTKASFNASIKGEHRGVDYSLVSSDYLDFEVSLVHK
jgi:hypothetical protein